MVLQIAGGLTQVACLPFADMTLLSANCVFAIFFNQVLAIRHLGERYIAKYDLTSLFFLSIGTVLLIQSSNTEDKVLDIDLIYEYLKDYRTLIVFMIFILLWIVTTVSRIKLVAFLDNFLQAAKKEDEKTSNKEGED